MDYLLVKMPNFFWKTNVFILIVLALLSQQLFFVSKINTKFEKLLQAKPFFVSVVKEINPPEIFVKPISQRSFDCGGDTFIEVKNYVQDQVAIDFNKTSGCLSISLASPVVYPELRVGSLIQHVFVPVVVAYGNESVSEPVVLTVGNFLESAIIVSPFFLLLAGVYLLQKRRKSFEKRLFIYKKVVIPFDFSALEILRC